MTTQVYLNSWYFYNNGSIGFGWMDTDQAREFMEQHEDDSRYEEWFIADIDNYTGFEFSNLDYCNVSNVLDSIDILESMDKWEQAEMVALGEYLSIEDVEYLRDSKDDYTLFADKDSYFDSCDECLDFRGVNDVVERYFDYDAYHRDCMFDAYEASNGVVILG